MTTQAKMMAAIIPVVLVPSLARDAQAKWVKEGTKKGVTVYSTDVQGSDIKKVKAITTVNATSDEVWAYLPEALSKSKSSGLTAKHLGKCGDNCEYIYQRIHHPLIKDRAYVLKFTWKVTEKDGLKTYRRCWRMASGKKAQGGIAPEKVQGSWTFRPVGDGSRTRVVFVSHMDLGHGVPAMLFNPGAIKKAYKMLGGFRKAFK